MNFIHTPYESGVALREDVFHRQFTIRVTGMMEYPEDDPVYGTYDVRAVLDVCDSSTISGAVENLLCLHESDEWPIRDENEDYYDSELGHDCGPVSFTPKFAEIYDRRHRRVLCGDFSAGLTWFTPVSSQEDVAALRTEQCVLRDDAAVEVSWDNYSTAERLRDRATRLSMHLTDLRYAALPEVVALATHSYTPQASA
ncbi:hypothetical protein BG55_01000 [Erwinia mallotivora]|uniref:Uncharacterized protein n=2 Tax=Erwinia mallotivora TaxID=69222 RepID=A0A014NTS6_9GAMM|nr:hypothetical protein BG55_01000 [Erwinia mallotivora]